MNDIVAGVVTIATAIIGVAILAVLVGSNAKTADVIAAGGSAFTGAIRAATGPVTGGTMFTGGGGVGDHNYY